MPDEGKLSLSEREPERIYLQPRCAEDACEGRMWCRDDVWGTCEECGLPSAQYVRADLYEVQSSLVRDLAEILKEARARASHDWAPVKFYARIDAALSKLSKTEADREPQ